MFLWTSPDISIQVKNRCKKLFWLRLNVVIFENIWELNKENAFLFSFWNFERIRKIINKMHLILSADSQCWSTFFLKNFLTLKYQTRGVSHNPYMFIYSFHKLVLSISDGGFYKYISFYWLALQKVKFYILKMRFPC